MFLIFNRLLEIVKISARAKVYQAKCSGSRVIVLTEEIDDDAENNTAVASVGSKYIVTKQSNELGVSE